MKAEAKLRAKYVLIRALRTVLVTLAGGVVVLTTMDVHSIGLLVSSAALAGLLSALTGYLDLPELTGDQAKWVAIVSRTLKTLVQTIVAGVPASAIYLQDIDWKVIVIQGVIASLATAFMAIASSLPEQENVTIK